MGIRGLVVSALFAAALLPFTSACDGDYDLNEGAVLESTSGAIMATPAEAAVSESTEYTESAAVAEYAEGAESGVEQPLWYENGPCGRDPSLWPFLYAIVDADHMHHCNVIANETIEKTGLWLWGAFRSDTGECCLFLQPNSRF